MGILSRLSRKRRTKKTSGKREGTRRCTYRPQLEALEDRVVPALGDLLHTLPNPTPAFFDVFGISVAVSGNRVVVGAQNDGGGAGAAYLFDAPPVPPLPPLPPPPQPPQPPLPPREFFAVLASVKVGRKSRLHVELRFTDNGALKSRFVAPFQKSKFRKIQVFALDRNQDGVNDGVLVLARRNGKLHTRVFSA